MHYRVSWSSYSATDKVIGTPTERQGPSDYVVFAAPKFTLKHDTCIVSEQDKWGYPPILTFPITKWTFIANYSNESFMASNGQFSIPP